MCLAGADGLGLRLLGGDIDVECIVCKRGGVCPALLMLVVALLLWCVEWSVVLGCGWADVVG